MQSIHCSDSLPRQAMACCGGTSDLLRTFRMAHSSTIIITNTNTPQTPNAHDHPTYCTTNALYILDAHSYALLAHDVMGSMHKMPWHASVPFCCTSQVVSARTQTHTHSKCAPRHEWAYASRVQHHVDMLVHQNYFKVPNTCRKFANSPSPRFFVCVCVPATFSPAEAAAAAGWNDVRCEHREWVGKKFSFALFMSCVGTPSHVAATTPTPLPEHWLARIVVLTTENTRLTSSRGSGQHDARTTYAYTY